MERRHFEAIAATLRVVRPGRGNKYASRTVKTKGSAAYEQWAHTCRELARTFQLFNAAFSNARFLAACGLDE